MPTKTNLGASEHPGFHPSRHEATQSDRGRGSLTFGWDSRAAKAAWTVGLVAAAFYAVFTVRKTLLIFVLALFLAYMILVISDC
jgi:hypothetical protein